MTDAPVNARRDQIVAQLGAAWAAECIDKAEMEVKKVVDDFAERFGWAGYLNWIASDDITKHKEILTYGHIECFNQLAFLEERRQRTENKESIR